MRLLCADTFYHDGRGPTLVHVHLRDRSAHIQAIDYELPGSGGTNELRRHLLFHNAQTYMFTPEEVEDYATSKVDWSKTNRGALVSLGKTAWLASFNPHHLERCEHYRAMFYDEFLDIICEGVSSEPGFFGS
jgi:hypothetical protein